MTLEYQIESLTSSRRKDWSILEKQCYLYWPKQWSDLIRVDTKLPLLMVAKEGINWRSSMWINICKESLWVYTDDDINNNNNNMVSVSYIDVALAGDFWSKVH